MGRYSEKREAILRCLQGMKEHPSAEWVYQRLKPLYPRLSLATVYRNLNQLQQEGRIVSVGKVLGQERFDACISPHAHAVCVCCGRVADADGVDVPEGLCAQIAAATGFDTGSASLHVYGLCPACRKKVPSSPSGIQE